MGKAPDGPPIEMDPEAALAIQTLSDDGRSDLRSLPGPP